MDTSIYTLRTRDILTLCVLALLGLGVLMVQSASSDVTNQTGWQWSVMGQKHVRFVAAAFITFLAVGAIDYRWIGKVRSFWKNPIVWLFIAAGILNLVVLIPHVGVELNHSRRWLQIGSVQMQPSEVAKWAVVVYLAYVLANRPATRENFISGFIPILIPVGAICLMVVIEDFGTATLIALCAMMMLLAGRVKWIHLLIVVPPVLAAGLWFITHKAYRMQRLTAFVDPYAAPPKEGYHMIQSLLSFSTGGITGRGLGNGIQKLGYLPEDTTDFIFAVICEELGIFGAMLTIALYLGILYCAWEALKRQSDDFGKMISFGVGAMVGLQAMMNIAVATVSVPTKGLPLPLVSAGGTGLIITCAALGLLRNACGEEKRADATDSAPASLPPPADEYKPATTPSPA